MVILRSTSLGTGKIQISLQSAMHPSQIDRDEVCSWVGILPTQIEDGEVHLRLVRALLHAVDDSEFASISLQMVAFQGRSPTTTSTTTNRKTRDGPSLKLPLEVVFAIAHVSTA
uniref:Uncharacterized protein n=1 Tax=Setaria viridis TaxID=4556 RepID=A0A4V6DA35_SETVI|nr:hypothetical protein SEVIR_3G315203v2 [Setaria viridis]